jgi:hypothetical protein
LGKVCEDPGHEVGMSHSHGTWPQTSRCSSVQKLSNSLNTILCFIETASHYVAQADLKFLDFSNPPVLASRVTGTTGVHVPPSFLLHLIVVIMVLGFELKHSTA